MQDEIINREQVHLKVVDVGAINGQNEEDNHSWSGGIRRDCI